MTVGPYPRRANSKGNDMWYVLALYFIGVISIFVADFTLQIEDTKEYSCPTRLGVLKGLGIAVLGPIVTIFAFVVCVMAFGNWARYSDWWNKPVCGKK